MAFPGHLRCMALVYVYFWIFLTSKTAEVSLFVERFQYVLIVDSSDTACVPFVNSRAPLATFGNILQELMPPSQLFGSAASTVDQEIKYETVGLKRTGGGGGEGGAGGGGLNGGGGGDGGGGEGGGGGGTNTSVVAIPEKLAVPTDACSCHVLVTIFLNQPEPTGT